MRLLHDGRLAILQVAVHLVGQLILQLGLHVLGPLILKVQCERLNELLLLHCLKLVPLPFLGPSFQ